MKQQCAKAGLELKLACFWHFEIFSLSLAQENGKESKNLQVITNLQQA